MENERSRIAPELRDDLGANLTQIQWLGAAATLAQSADSGENELINRITRKSRDMVRLIDEIVWAVNPKNDTLEQLVTYVCNFGEQYFRDSPTRCRIDVADTIPDYKLESDVRHHLFLIAKEALHNVAKHGVTDRVWVRVTCTSARAPKSSCVSARGPTGDHTRSPPDRILKIILSGDLPDLLSRLGFHKAQDFGSAAACALIESIHLP